MSVHHINFVKPNTAPAMALRDQLRELIYSHAGTMSVAEVLGVVEIVKMEIFEEHQHGSE